MGFLLPSTIFIFGFLIAPVNGRRVTGCFFSDFEHGDVTVFYDEGGEEEGHFEVAIEVDGSETSAYFNVHHIGDPGFAVYMTDNYYECLEDIRECEAHVGLIFDPTVRVSIAEGAPVKVLIRDSNNTDFTASCAIDGRNLDIVAVPSQTLANPTDDIALNFGTDIETSAAFVIPIDGEPNGLQASDNAGVTQGVKFTYSGAASAEQLLGASATLGSLESFEAKNVAKVETFADQDGSFCGMSLKDDNNVELARFDTCTVRSVSGMYSIEFGFRLGGFMQFGTAQPFQVVPLQYNRVSPSVLYYTRSSEGLTFTVKSFFTTTGAVTYDYSHMDGLTSSGVITSKDVTSQSLGDISSTAAGSDTFDVEFDDVCGCFPVEVHINAEVDTDVDDLMYTESQEFFGWAVGFSTDEVLYGSGSPAYNSGSTVFTYSFHPEEGKCPEMYPHEVATVGGVIWVDGWLFTQPANTIIPEVTTSITEPVSKVYVHVDGSDAVTGLTLTTGRGSSNVTVGDTAQDIASTLEAPSTNHYLQYLSTMTSARPSPDNQLYLSGITAGFGRPMAPCYVVTEDAEEYNTDLSNADMMTVHWYAPADFTSVTASITGLFVALNTENLMADVVPMDMSEFDRGEVYTAHFYHLRPHNDYNFTLMGTAEPSSGFVMETPDTDEVSFTTADGLSLVCTNSDSPIYTNKIDWSAVPEVETKYTDGPLQDMGGTQTSSYNSKSSQQFPAGSFFHYEDNSLNHPVFDDFRGVPNEVILYRSGGESCVRAIGLRYQWASGSSQWYYLGVASAASLAGFSEESLTFAGPVHGIKLSRNTGDGCLNAVEFVLGDLVDGGVCLDGDSNVGDCGEFTDYEDSKELYALTAESDGTYIVALQAHWVEVDIPTLKSNGEVCSLDFTTNPFNIRESYWELELDLTASTTQCGTIYTVTAANGVHDLIYEQMTKRLRDAASETIDGEGDVSITRANAWEVTTECVYHADGQVTSSFDTTGEAPQKAVGLDAIEFSMHMYKDHTYSETYSTVPTLLLGEKVYIATELEENLYNSVLKNFECFATETQVPDGTNYYLLSADDGCPADASFEWEDLGDDHKDAFMFDVFAWVDSGSLTLDTVYVHCTVRVCPTEDRSTCDERGCSEARRARRDVSELASRGIKEKTVTLDTPILVKRREVETLSINRDPIVINEDRAMTVASLFGLFATVTFFCLLVIGYRVHTVRKSYYRLKNEADAAN